MKYLPILLAITLPLTSASHSQDKLKLGGSSESSQNSEAFDGTYGKKNYFGINPFGLIFNLYSGEYGRFLNSGESEINIPFVFFKYNQYMYYGIGGKYRIYNDKSGQNFFYGGGIYFTSWNWDFYLENSDVTWISIVPVVEAGWRWSWENGWTIAPSLELGYRISGIKSKYKEYIDNSYESGFSWGLNIGLAYMFNF